MLCFDFLDYLIGKYFPAKAIEGNFSLISLRFALAASLAIFIAYLSRTYFEEWFLQFKKPTVLPVMAPGVAVVPLVSGAASVEVDRA